MRVEDRLGGAHLLLVLEVLEHDGRALLLVEQDLDPGGLHPLGRAARDPLLESREAIGVHVGEPDYPYVHVLPLWSLTWL